MEWLYNLFFGTGIAQAVLVISLVITIGILLGKIRICGISLGVTWILFVGIAMSHFGMSIDNVFIAAKRKGMNPQYGFQGGQGRYYVPARVFAFQLNLKF